MKTNKALRRLTKVKALMSDVTERYVSLAPAVRKALRDAMAAVTVAMDAVSLEVSEPAKNVPVERPEATSKAAPGTPKAKRKVNAASVPKEVSRGQAKTAAKTRKPVKSAVVTKTAAKKKSAPVPAHSPAVAQTAGQ